MKMNMASNESVQIDHSDTLLNTDLWVCISHDIIVSLFQRRKSLSETLERPLSAENHVFYEHPTQMSHHTKIS